MEISGIFLIEIEKQCKFAITAFEYISIGLEKNDHNLLWYSLQNFLIAVGNISKILWPSNKAYTKRGEYLRRFFNVEDNSSLKQRTFRNHFEHFDERLEDWAKSSKKNNFIDSNVGSIVSVGGIEDCLRNFDSDTWCLTFQGDQYDIKQVETDIQRILSRIKK